MADEATVSVEIPIPDTEETPAPPVAPITVVESAQPSVDPTVLQELLDARERAVRAEQRNAELEAQIAEATGAAVMAQASAELVAEQVNEISATVEDLAEGEPIEADDDIEPHREHLFWKKF